MKSQCNARPTSALSYLEYQFLKGFVEYCVVGNESRVEAMLLRIDRLGSAMDDLVGFHSMSRHYALHSSHSLPVQKLLIAFIDHFSLPIFAKAVIRKYCYKSHARSRGREVLCKNILVDQVLTAFGAGPNTTMHQEAVLFALGSGSESPAELSLIQAAQSLLSSFFYNLCHVRNRFSRLGFQVLLISLTVATMDNVYVARSPVATLLQQVTDHMQRFLVQSDFLYKSFRYGLKLLSEEPILIAKLAKFSYSSMAKVIMMRCCRPSRAPARQFLTIESESDDLSSVFPQAINE